MSDIGWFATFAAIGLIMIGVSAWMVWFSRRAMKSHKRQIDEMVEEMRELIDKGEDESGS